MLGIDRTICSVHKVNEKVKYPIRGVKVRLFSAVTGFCLLSLITKITCNLQHWDRIVTEFKLMY